MKTLRRILKKPLNIVAIVLIFSIVSMAFFPKFFSTHDPLEMDYESILEPPSRKHFFGTDQFGRDMYSRCVHGVQKSVVVAFSSTSIACLFGTALGLISGYYGGLLDLLIMRVCDSFFAFPTLVLALFIVALFGNSLLNLIIAIAIVYTPIFARTIRGSVLSVKENLFVKASKTLGSSDLRIMLFHVLPNVSSILIVTFTTNLSTAFLTEASLGFLGLSVPPPQPTLGGLVAQATAFLATAPWMALFPGAIIALIVLSLNVLGDALRDLLDPKR
ncbi:MAG: ABC transporter permease [Thermotoga caldifontis]|uniref:ABC transporter permease n=1 Tax=Thermotoga caldifontis TaxID=1508419 RepID=UPI003C7D8874